MQRAMAASSRSRDGTILINRSIDYGLVDGIIDGGVREGPSEKTVCVCVHSAGLLPVSLATIIAFGIARKSK